MSTEKKDEERRNKSSIAGAKKMSIEKKENKLSESKLSNDEQYLFGWRARNYRRLIESVVKCGEQREQRIKEASRNY